MVNTFIIDLETFYDEEAGYSLRKMSLVEYINHPKFKILGMGVQINDGKPFWISNREYGIRNWVRTYIQPEDIVVAHNVKFDGAILAWKYGVKPAQWRDTKSMAMAVYGSSVPSFSLKSLGEKIGTKPKGQLNTDGLSELDEAQERELAEYCLTDVEICAKLYQELALQIPESQWPIMDWTIRAFTEPKLEVNIETAKRVQWEIEERKKRVLASCGVDAKVLASNQQFAAYLRKLGYQLPMKKNPKGELIPALALGDPEFIAMTQSQDEQLRRICLARKEVKKTMEVKRAEKIQTIGTSYPFDVIFSGATQTHRFSGGSGAGGNPQNFPRESALRSCIQAPEGSQLLCGDFKNIELRILAFLSREPKLVKAIREGVDVYSEFASKIFNRTITKDDETERHFGKAAILGLGYGMGFNKFAKTVKLQGLEVSESLAKQTVYLYRDHYTHVPNFWKMCEVVIRMMANGQNGFFPGFSAIKVKKNALVLPSGLELKFPNLRREEDEWIYDKFKSQVTKTDKVKLYGGKLTENICQALAGEICKESISRLIKAGCSPSGQVHDELLLVTSDRNDSERLALTEAMTARLPWWPELVLDAEIGSGQNWMEAKKPKKAVVYNVAGNYELLGEV